MHVDMCCTKVTESECVRDGQNHMQDKQQISISPELGNGHNLLLPYSRLGNTMADN